jgi:hypothetical protein
MKVVKEHKDPFMTSEIDEMVAQLRAAGHKKRPPTKDQAPSTVAALARQAKRRPEDDEDYWNRPMPPESEWRVEKDAEKVFAEQNKAKISDVIAAESLRREPKNQIGESKLSATTPERRASAIHHFEVAGNVSTDKAELDRIVGLTEIKSAAPVKEIRKLTAWQAFRYWLAGGKIWESKDE